MQNNRLLLQKLKTSSIKDYIYSNKAIPPIWRNKLSYQDEVLNVIHNDLNFLKYLGNTTPKTLSTSSSFTNVLPQVRAHQKKLQHCASFETLRNDNEIQNEPSSKETNVRRVERSCGNHLYKRASFPNENEPTKDCIDNTALHTKEQILKNKHHCVLDISW